MTHKIKVQMFGNFRMDYNGAPFVAEKMHKESQFNRMMQALIHYSDCGIAKDKLEEIVIGERDIDAPHTALRVIVYQMVLALSIGTFFFLSYQSFLSYKYRTDRSSFYPYGDVGVKRSFAPN